MKIENALRISEEKLFDEWRLRMVSLSIEQPERFVPDGVVDPEQFTSISPKIVLLLKEVYDDPDKPDWSPWKLWEVLSKGEQNEGSHTWDVASRWISAIYFGDHPWNPSHNNKPFWYNDSSDKEFRARMLRKIAIVNVKKVGGVAKSDPPEIRKHAKDYCDLIFRQISLYTPRLIISGLWDMKPLLSIFKDQLQQWKNTSHYQYCNVKGLDAVLVDANHPGARFKRQSLHDHLVETIREIGDI